MRVLRGVPSWLVPEGLQISATLEAMSKRTGYRLTYSFICFRFRLIEEADIYQIAKKCRARRDDRKAVSGLSRP